MALITKPFTFSPGTLIQSAQVNSDFDTIYADYNGNITGDNILSVTEAKVTFSATGHAHSGGTGGAPIQWVAGSAITSAATITIPTDGNLFAVTGTTAISAINARTSGVFAILVITSALLQITHNGTSLILQDAKDYISAAGDVMCLVSLGSGNWREVWRRKPATRGTYGVTGADCSTGSTTTFLLDADVLKVRDSAGNIIVVENPGGAVTNTITTAGPAANGRDQAGAFGAASFVHFYWIYNPLTQTVASISSAVAPPTGPTLLAGYTHWAYACAVYLDAGSLLKNVRLKGNLVTYDVGEVAVTGNITVATEVTVAVSTMVPANAMSFLLAGETRIATTGTFTLRYITTRDHLIVTNLVSLDLARSFSTEMPNVSQQYFYIHSEGAGTRATRQYVTGYRVPNGAA